MSDVKPVVKPVVKAGCKSGAKTATGSSAKAVAKASAMPVVNAPDPGLDLTPKPVPESAPSEAGGGLRQLELMVGPLDDPQTADHLVGLFSEVPDLGTIEPLDGGQGSDGMRRFKAGPPACP